MNTKQQSLPGLAQSDSVIMTPDASGRCRRQVKFWLDANKPEQATMGKKLDAMRKDKTKNFSQFMRDAIRLMFALLLGDISVLSELFPQAIEAIRADLQAENAALRATIEAQQSQLEQLQKQLDKPQTAGDGLEEIVRRAIADEMTKHREPVSVPVGTTEAPQTPTIGANQGGLKPLGNSGGLKQIGGLNRIAPPVTDDTDDLELTVNKAKFDGNATQNFLTAMKALQTKGKK